MKSIVISTILTIAMVIAVIICSIFVSTTLMSLETRIATYDIYNEELSKTSKEYEELLDEYRKDLLAIGFEFSVGRYSVSVSAIPDGIEIDAVGDMLTVMAERIKENTGSAKLTRDIIFEKALYQGSCKAAIKAGREYAPEHIKWIVDKLMLIPDITFCPHGRPVAMEMSHKLLDRQFERC
jgi:DNA mismatch repair protein MutL